ncbi:hypothetical protein ZW22_004383 [Salmonella enterica subsp. enterica serovar Oranienburg]|nr:hypothetical protein [Salmonella enterica subsp. enterica serovar Oranienburg]
MKKTLTAIVLSAVLAPPVALAIGGGGVIVEDPGSIAKTVEVIAKAKEQLDQLKEQVATAKGQLDAFKNEVIDTKKRLEGFSDYSTIFGSAESYMKDFWNDMSKDLSAADIRKIADKYGFDTTEYQQIEAQYKEKFEQVTRYEKLAKDIELSSGKLARAQTAFRNATTPQQREELRNNIILETSTMQAKIAQTDTEVRRMEKEQKLREEAALRKYSDDNFSLKPAK